MFWPDGTRSRRLAAAAAPQPLRRMKANKCNISASYGINFENSLAKHGRLVLRLIVPPNLAEIHFSLA
jgi:hypothetical protein